MQFPSRRQCNRCVHGISFILIITGGACHIIERPIEIMIKFKRNFIMCKEYFMFIVPYMVVAAVAILFLLYAGLWCTALAVNRGTPG